MKMLHEKYGRAVSLLNFLKRMKNEFVEKHLQNPTTKEDEINHTYIYQNVRVNAIVMNHVVKMKIKHIEPQALESILA